MAAERGPIGGSELVGVWGEAVQGNDSSGHAGILMIFLLLERHLGGAKHVASGACWDCTLVPKGTFGVQADSDDPPGG